MYIIPVWHDVYHSYIAWCILFLFGMMYTIPVSHFALYSRKIAVYIIPVLHVVTWDLCKTSSAPPVFSNI